ncbi:MAG: ATP-binding cassette domain-containing protein [Sphingobacteriaceae bacterium]
MIQVDQLSKSYGNQKAVDQLSFIAQPGQVVGFLGPNGAGKSTTMKMLSGFLQPDSGTAQVCGFDIINQSMEVRSCLGYLPEHNPLYLDLYVKEALGFMADIYQVKQKALRIAEVIALCGLGEEQNKKIGALSKGYRQRVGLAQAIIHDPEVLILDEPTSGLDPNQVVDIRNLIISLGKTKTVLVSTHIMQEVEAICDQIIIIAKGKLMVNQTKPDLFATKPGKNLEQIFNELTA